MVDCLYNNPNSSRKKKRVFLIKQKQKQSLKGIHPWNCDVLLVCLARSIKMALRRHFVIARNDFHAILKVIHADGAGNHIPLARAVFLGVLFLLVLDARLRIV